MNIIKSYIVTNIPADSGTIAAGGGVWGAITGSLSDQTDLHNALGLLEVTPQTADYTLVLTDAFRTVPVNAATTKTVTVPANASVAFPINTVIGVKWETGAVGQPAVAAAVGVTINNTAGNLLVPAATTVGYLKKIGTNEWDFYNGVAGSGSGDVAGPSSALDGAIVLYDGTTGKLIKDSTKVLSTVGGNLAALANPGAVRFLRINADNTVTARTAAEMVTDLLGTRRFVLTGTPPSTSSTSETILGAITIPANTFLANDKIRIKLFLTKVGAVGGLVFDLKVNTTEVLAGATDIGTLGTVAGNLSIPFQREIFVKASNSSLVFPAATQVANDDIVVSTICTTLTTDWTVQQVIFVAVDLAAADTITTSFFDIEIIR